jgi:hypothetical protein
MADEPIKVEGAPPPASPAAPELSSPVAGGPPQSPPPPVVPPEAASSAAPVAAEPPKVEEPPAREPTLLKQYEDRKAAADAAAEADRVAKLAEITAKPPEPEKPAAAKIEGKEEKAPEPAKIEAEPAAAEPTTEKTPEPQGEVFSFTDFAIPDDFQTEYEQGKDRIATFKDILTKADFNPQQRGQALLDMHTEAMRAYAAEVTDRQHKVWNDYQKQEQIAAMTDPVIGGPRFETAMGAVARVRDRGLTNAEEAAGLNEWLERTGAGSNRWFLRWAHNLARYITEPNNPPVDIKPPPDAGQRPGRRASVLYDNPRS